MAKRFPFPKQARLLREQDFRRVYRAGLRLRSFPLRLCALSRPEGKSRLGLAIGVATGSAVVRNRWKRAVREAFRLNRHRLRCPYDLAVSVSREASPHDVPQVEAAFLKLIEALNAAEGGRQEQ